MKKYLLITVGTGQDIEKGMLVSIIQQKPDKVVFLATEEAINYKKETLEEMLREKDIEYKWVKLSSHEDFEIALEEMVNAIREFKEKRVILNFDITFGTKPLTAAMAFLGFKIGQSISYVSGSKRDEHGKVISGTERLSIIPTNGIRAKMAIEEAIKFYNEYMFLTAKRIIQNHIELIGKKHPIRKLMETLMLLSEINILRDNFKFDSCAENIEKLAKLYCDEVSKLFNIDKNKLERTLYDFAEQYKAISKNNFESKRLGELIASARRSAKIGRFNDAVARLYRALEFIAQMKLYELDKIDDDMYLKCKVIDGKCEDIENYRDKPTGLVEMYRCLYHLGYGIASKIIDIEKNQPCEILTYRNKSILAHGFKSVDEENYKKFYSLVEEIGTEMNYDIKPVMEDLKIKEIQI